ncbi:MAG: DUF5590 domain-containing protein [Lactovum sp.]
MKKRRQFSKLDQLMMGSLVIVLAGFFSYYLFVFTAVSPLTKTRDQVIQIVKEKTSMVKVETFNIVTTDKTYYSLIGKNSADEDLAIVIPKEPGEIYEVKLSEGVDVSSLPQENATTIDFAIFKGKLVWEVNTKEEFKIYDFKTGEEV